MVRLILSTADEAETMIVSTPRSQVVTVIHSDPQKGGGTVMKRMGVRLIRWKKFCLNLEMFIGQAEGIQDGSQADVEHHLGGGLHVTMSASYPFRQLREFYRDKDGVLRPGKMGIKLTLDELLELKCHVDHFNGMIPGFDAITLCDDLEGHDAGKCRECHVK